jgi:hypothetical protein
MYRRMAEPSHRNRTLPNIVAVLAVAAAALFPAVAPRQAHANTPFPQTGYSIWGPFEQYFYAHGGINQFGLPRTSTFPAGPGYDGQWFERALFTYDPTKPDPYKVELNLLGTMVAAKRTGEAPFVATTAATSGQFFAETGHNLSDKFLAYWQSNGGLPIYGYPISEPFMEQSKSDGKMYLVQYFERNRLEFHPELAGTKYEIQLGLLGSELLDAQGGPAYFDKLGVGKIYPPPTAAVVVPGGGLVNSPNAGTPEPVDTTIPPAPALVSTDKPELYSTDFSNSDLSDWVPAASYNPNAGSPAAWNVQDGVLHQSGAVGDGDVSSDALLVTKRNDFSDLSLETYLYPTGGESIGTVLRWSPQGYYAVRLYIAAPNAQPKAELLLVTPTGGKVLAEAQSWPGFTTRQWTLVKFSAHGNQLSVEIDGQPVMQATDSTLTSGSIGLYSYADGTAYFDNLRASIN